MFNKNISVWCIILGIVILMVVHHILSDKPLVEGIDSAAEEKDSDIQNSAITGISIKCGTANCCPAMGITDGCPDQQPADRDPPSPPTAGGEEEQEQEEEEEVSPYPECVGILEKSDCQGSNPGQGCSNKYLKDVRLAPKTGYLQCQSDTQGACVRFNDTAARSDIIQCTH